MDEVIKANAGSADDQARRGHQGTAPDHKAAEVDLNFRLLFSALYHDGCERILARRHRALTALNLVLGSGAAVAVGTQYPVLAQAMALAVAVIGAVQLVWAFDRLAYAHGTLRQDYYRLMSDFRRGRDAADVESQMIKLFGVEPPIIERERRRAHDKAGASLYGDDFNKA